MDIACIHSQQLFRRYGQTNEASSYGDLAPKVLKRTWQTRVTLTFVL